jgi:hypothetical protein
MFKYTFLIALAFLTSAGSVSAETILRTGETVSINEDRVVVGDFYTLASITNISGRIEGDLIAASGRFTVNGEVVEDIFAIGGSVDVYGPVGDDVRVVGSEVVIAEPVAGNVFVLGNNVSILSTASIGGDLLVYGRDVEISGSVDGDVLGGFGSLRIDAAVGGDVNVTTDQLTLGENADITGTLSYKSANLVERSPNAIVTGEIIRTDRVAEETTRDLMERYVSMVLVLAFAILTWYLVSRRTLKTSVDRATVYSPTAALFGFAFLIITPLVAGVLLTSLLGSLVAIFLLLMYALLGLLALVMTPAVIGHLVRKVSTQTSGPLSLATIMIGLLVTALLPVIPLVGPAVIAAVFIVSIGALVDALVSKLRT